MFRPRAGTRYLESDSHLQMNGSGLERVVRTSDISERWKKILFEYQQNRIDTII